MAELIVTRWQVSPLYRYADKVSMRLHASFLTLIGLRGYRTPKELFACTSGF